MTVDVFPIWPFWFYYHSKDVQHIFRLRFRTSHVCFPGKIVWSLRIIPSLSPVVTFKELSYFRYDTCLRGQVNHVEIWSFGIMPLSFVRFDVHRRFPAGRSSGRGHCVSPSAPRNAVKGFGAERRGLQIGCRDELAASNEWSIMVKTSFKLCFLEGLRHHHFSDLCIKSA